MPKFLNAFTAICAALSLALAQAAPAFAGAAMSRAELEACQAQDEQAFRDAIAGVIQASLRKGMADYDYAGAVGDAWRNGKLDAVIDERVDVAASEIREESSWGSLLQTLAYNKKAQELATAVADRVYRSEAMKAALERLAAAVGQDVGKRIEMVSAQTQEPALSCLRAYLGPRYGSTVTGIVSAGAAQGFAFDPSKGGAGVSSTDVLRESGGGIAGAVILLVRRQLANMAGRIGARLVGSVLSRLVSVVAGGIGVVLIATDLWDLRLGVLPTIVAEMKSPETKGKVREELAKTVREEIEAHVADIGAKAADQVLDVWRTFRRAHAKALEIAEKNESFRAFLDTLAPDAIPRLDEVLSIILASEGEDAILKRLADGTLEESVKRLPPSGLDIARETRSVESALKWSAAAGQNLDKVFELGIHKRADPAAFDRASLDRIFAVGDRLAMTRLATIPREARDALFELDTADLGNLARHLSEGQLETLARYLGALDKAARERVLRAVAAEPAKMQVLGSARVRDAILASQDQGAAVALVLRQDGPFPIDALTNDFRMAWEGRVSPVLLWEKHPAALAAGAVLALLVLLLLRRLFFPSRRRYA